MNSLIRELLAVAGIVCFVAGVAMIWVPAALIVAGVGAVVTAMGMSGSDGDR